MVWLVICSIIASCVCWLIIWLVSIGEDGSWLRSCVTSSFMKTSESIVWDFWAVELAARAAACAVGSTLPVMPSMGMVSSCS